MIETLTNLKNNKLKRNVTQNQGGAAVERLKKFLSGLTKSRHSTFCKPYCVTFPYNPNLVLAHEPLRVSLEDLHAAETKGKWWLVGAAWSGDPLIDKQAEFSKSAATKPEQEAAPSESADLIKLARSQGMNTDIRRGIFVVLMSSDVGHQFLLCIVACSMIENRFLGLC
jgi:nucleolar MIF4G domain-containing protein 1